MKCFNCLVGLCKLSYLDRCSRSPLNQMSSPPASAAVRAPRATEQGVLAGAMDKLHPKLTSQVPVRRPGWWSGLPTAQGLGMQRANRNPGLRRPPHPRVAVLSSASGPRPPVLTPGLLHTLPVSSREGSGLCFPLSGHIRPAGRPRGSSPSY